MNPSTPFGHSQEFAEAQSSTQIIFAIFGVLFVVMIIYAIARAVQNQVNYTQAKQDYLENPSDRAAKIRLVETTQLRNGNMQSGGIEAIAMMEATRDPIVINNASPSNLTAELEALADLHAKGHLTEAEFGAAKAKLLS